MAGIPYFFNDFTDDLNFLCHLVNALQSKALRYQGLYNLFRDQ
jgi:hypothetical protein